MLLTPYLLHGFNPYRRYDIRSGLPDNSVKDICQDSRGYMWFATKDGFCRFDGHEFDTYGSSISGSHLNIDAICPHIDGKHIWLGCTDILMIFNPDTAELKPFSCKSQDGKQIRCCISLEYDITGDLWIGTDNGVYRWDETSGKLTRYRLTDSPTVYVKDLLHDTKNNIWAGTDCGLYVYDRLTDSFDLVRLNSDMKYDISAITQSADNRLLLGTQTGILAELDIQSGRLTEYPATDTSGHLLPVTRIHSIFRKKGDVYLIGSDTGLFTFDRQTGEWLASRDILADDSIYKFFRDREGGLWTGTYFSGVNYLSPRQDEIQWFYDDGRPGSLNGNAVSEFCEDGNGNMWIATENGGLNFFEPSTGKITDYSHLSHNNLHALELDGDRLWIGTFSKGLDCLDLGTMEITRLHNIPGDSTSLCNNYIYAIHKSSEGTLYVGTMAGLCILDRKTGRFSKVPETGNSFIYDIAEDREGNIWVASKVDGIYRRSRGTGEWKHYRHDSKDPSSPMTDRYIRIYMDTSGDMWFCCESSGISRYNTPPTTISRTSVLHRDCLTASATASLMTEPAICGCHRTAAS